jgi:hypothetical protein
MQPCIAVVRCEGAAQEGRKNSALSSKNRKHPTAAPIASWHVEQLPRRDGVAVSDALFCNYRAAARCAAPLRGAGDDQTST